MHGNRDLLRQISMAIAGELPEGLRNEKRAWFTDTLEDVNGVARTIRTMSRAAARHGADLTVVTSRMEVETEDIRIQNFRPVGEFELPEYELQKLAFPPMLDMIDWIQQEGFNELIISTPGPVGLTALGAAKLMGIRTSGIYHTDFPQYVRILTEDDLLETMMWKFMHWFYSQLDLVYVNSEFYRECWIHRGIPAEKIKILPRGLDSDAFNMRHSKTGFWKERGAKGPVMLYVGRVSKEKDLEFLARVFRRLKNEGLELDLAIVGDGPYLEELKRSLPEAIFTGILSGEALSTAYASADLFVFPSTTDTFGNVVIEAMASGLPALVSDIGGPKELIDSEQQGRVLPANSMQAWCVAIRELIEKPPSGDILQQNADRVRERWSWETAFGEFWQREANMDG
jgi:glycosyltransferase involved in cell wall biosynthesis